MPSSRRNHDVGSVATPGVPRNQSLERAVAVLRTVARSTEPSTTTEIAAAVGLPRATAARMLATLADAGLVDRPAGDRGWILGYELMRLARTADPYSGFIRRAHATLEQLTARTGESSVLAITRPPLEVEIVSQVDAPTLLRATNWVGRHFGLHASVSGKLAFARLAPAERDALLADHAFAAYTARTIVDRAQFRGEIERVRADGIAWSIDELELGLAMVGVDVPRASPLGAVASVGIMGPTSRVVPVRATLERAARHAARELARLTW
jgi:DNA-binding IclR family transcriptional regulator